MNVISKECGHLGLDALVEVHTEEELEAALKAGARLVGINNRNLNDFSVSLETTFKLLPKVPSDIIVVSESGIKGREEAKRLKEAGIRAILVGESLVLSPDPLSKIREFLGV